jgi:hypothetical protein
MWLAMVKAGLLIARCPVPKAVNKDGSIEQGFDGKDVKHDADKG